MKRKWIVNGFVAGLIGLVSGSVALAPGAFASNGPWAGCPDDNSHMCLWEGNAGTGSKLIVQLPPVHGRASINLTDTKYSRFLDGTPTNDRVGSWNSPRCSIKAWDDINQQGQSFEAHSPTQATQILQGGWHISSLGIYC
jgi:hypothetical protein